MDDEVVRISQIVFFARKGVAKDEKLAGKVAALLYSRPCFDANLVVDNDHAGSLQKKQFGHNNHIKHNKHNKYNHNKPVAATFATSTWPEKKKTRPVSMMSLLNKLNETNYDRILGGVKDLPEAAEINVEQIIAKAVTEHSYIPMYLKLVKDLLSIKRACPTRTNAAIMRAIDTTMPEIVAAHDSAARLKCEYEEFCRGNVDVARAVGINLVAMQLLVDPIDGLDGLGRPTDYLADRLLVLQLNDLSSKLIGDYFDRFRSAQARNLLEAVYVSKSTLTTNKTKFAIEACLRSSVGGRRSRY